MRLGPEAPEDCGKSRVSGASSQGVLLQQGFWPMKHPWSSPQPGGNPCAQASLCFQDFLFPDRLTYLWATMAASPGGLYCTQAHPLQACGLGPHVLSQAQPWLALGHGQ